MSLPELFVKNIHELLADSADGVLKALEDEPVVSIRVNRAKWSAPFPGDVVPWASDGFYLPQRVPFTFDPLFHAGCYYVQEASSMFLEQVVRQYVKQPVMALDLCAAPGGKSTLLRSVLPEGSLLVSNEVIASRAQVLVENIVKWGHPDCVVTNAAPADFGGLPSVFDMIVADVPCSGEGMFRKDPVAIAEWSERNVETCWRRGRDILAACWNALKPGGLLVYSTCTFNLKEDEENVCWIRDALGADVLTIETHPEWGITGSLLNSRQKDALCSTDDSSLPVYRFLPGRTKGEGFFLAVLRKYGEAVQSEAIVVNKKQSARSAQKAIPVPQQVKSWLNNPDSFIWQSDQNGIHAYSKQYAERIDVLRQLVKVLHVGVNVAEWKGRDVAPSQSLAMSTSLSATAFPCVELSYDDALAFLRREMLVLPATTPRGFVLLMFRGVPLGFVKNIGNRANNLYPADWRIRTTHLPDGEVRVL